MSHQSPSDAVGWPASTYRLQLTGAFGFSQVEGIAEYLSDLGVSHAYLSPIFQTGAADSHGYDACDFDRVNGFLGGEEGFERLVRALKSRGLGVILDFAPNHMGVASIHNRWWTDVLENGRASAWADFFDIDWAPEGGFLEGKILLPVLGGPYAGELEAGRLKIVWEEGAFRAAYYHRRFPLNQSFYRRIAERLATESADASAGSDMRTALNRALGDTPNAASADKLRSFFRTASESDEFRAATAAILDRINGQPGQAQTFSELHAILEDQAYQLAFWRRGAEEVNYRRFFDISDLAALRMERAEVFACAHRRLADWIARGWIDGLRIDHPDGLADPAEYFQRLQRLAAMAKPRSPPGAAPKPRLFVIAEKILAPDESIPGDWEIAGTTGYEFLSRVNNLFVDSSQEQIWSDTYRRFAGETAEFARIAVESKRQLLRGSFAGEWRALARRLKFLAAADPAFRDLTPSQLGDGLAAIISALAVYRTYRRPEEERVAERDRLYLTAAIDAAAPELADPALVEFFRNILLDAPPAEPQARQRWWDFIRRFQQLTGPVMAKGIEDTAFYRHCRLASLNEVGGNPAQFGEGVEAFHRWSERQARQHPHSLLATATHDAKRGEETRARINALSEMGGLWSERVFRWSQMNRRWKTTLPSGRAPSANDEWLFYQTLAGAWPPALSDTAAPQSPIEPRRGGGDSEGEWKCATQSPEAGSDAVWNSFRRRALEYAIKAAKESKLQTSWTDPDPAYETALRQFVERALDWKKNAEFLGDFNQFQKAAAFFGAWNSLSQIALKCLGPGTPDVYQGSELWDLSLVDPDNRRPVDFERRARLLSALDEKEAAPDLLETLAKRPEDGALKLFALSRLLRFRRAQRAFFESAEYAGCETRGDARAHLCAFVRQAGDRAVLAAAPRLVCGLARGQLLAPIGPVWGQTRVRLPGPARACWRDFWTGQRAAPAPESPNEILAADLLRHWPIGIWLGGFE